MEEKPAKAGASADSSRAGPPLTMTDDSGNNEGVDGSMTILDAEGDVGAQHLSVENSEREDDGAPDSLSDDNDDEKTRGRSFRCFRSVALLLKSTMLLRGLDALHVGQLPR